MNLFNRKTIARHIAKTPEPDGAKLAVLKEWGEFITSGRILSQKETALHGEFNKQIVQDVLGYIPSSASDSYTVAVEQQIIRGSVDLALGHFGGERPKTTAPFELKGAKTKDLDAIMPGRAKSPVQQAWEYATQNPGTKWVLVSNYLEIRLYGFGEGTQVYEHFDLAKLHEPEECKRFLLLLSQDNLLTGSTQALLEESRKEDKDITDALYDDYKALRLKLISAINDSGKLEPLKAISAAQTILDRVLFIAFAEDTGLLPQNTLRKAFEHQDPYNPRPVWQTFTALFKAIDEGSHALGIPRYNGGLFAPDPDVNVVTLNDKTCEAFKKIGDYDFASEISVTVLGHIFEQSIADMERLQAQARGEEIEEKKATGTTGRRKRDGVVYTPDYVARFIVEHTIGTHLREIFTELLKDYTKKSFAYEQQEEQEIDWKNKKSEAEFWRAYRDEISKLRIVDPACGSGVFLVTTFDFLKAELARVNTRLADLGKADLFDPDSEILTHNLYGVDVNSESVEITKLSLWIKTAKPGKVLDDLDGNIRVGDSLIEDSNFAYLDHAFTWKDAFPEIFKEGGFDIVLGNPPYVRQELLSPLKPYLQKRFEVYHGVGDLYTYFFERGLRLLKPSGRLGYISSSTFFKTSSGAPLRQFLAKNATIETVVDFGDVQIFEGVTTYPAIMTMKNTPPSNQHQIAFWNVNAIPDDSFRATFREEKAEFPQAALGESSWEFEDPKLLALRQKITKGKKTLKEVYGSPLYGIKTGRNEAFVINRDTREKLIVEDPKSAEIIKPFLEGKDLKRWHAEPRDIYLIFTRRGIDIDAYPAVKAYLEQYREILESKPKDWKPSFSGETWQGRKTGEYRWYEIQDTVGYWQEFEKPKIMYAHFLSKPNGFLDDHATYCNNKCYILSNVGWYELALFTSNVLWLAFTGMTTMMRGGYYEATTQNIVKLPIPTATDTQKAELGALAEMAQTHAETRYTLQENFRHRIPDLAANPSTAKLNTKLKEWWKRDDFQAFRAEVKKVFKQDIPLDERNDWEAWWARDRAEIHRLSGEIKTTEDKINSIVYNLFELTDAEIELLEESI